MSSADKNSYSKKDNNFSKKSPTGDQFTHKF